jgi:hypothetical protein
MANISRVQHEALADGFLDLLGEDAQNFEKVELSDVNNTIIQLAAKYIDIVANKINEKDVASSGYMADSMAPTMVAFDGKTYRIGITAPDYSSYQDEGVNGWAVDRGSRFSFKTPGVDRGSRFSFKTRGVDPNGEMVKSVKQWIQREGASARNVKRAVTSRERKGQSMPDPTTRAAVRASYFIKKKGIKPRRFWKEATDEFVVEMEKELGIALKIDIINCITK